jgi:hypothetical protein
MTRLRAFAALFLALALCGCAATQVALEKKDLKVETQMSDTIFLDIEKQTERSVFVDVRNTSDKELGVRERIIDRLRSKGYTIAETPQRAFYILQANILYVGMADPSALRESLYAGYGGVLAGGLAGGLIGAAAGGSTGAAYGAGIGALVGGTAELVAGSLTKDVTYTIMTDVMISERTKTKVAQSRDSDLKVAKSTRLTQQSKTTEERYRYQTRILSTANKVNLKFEEALPALENGLAMAISGIF